MELHVEVQGHTDGSSLALVPLLDKEALKLRTCTYESENSMTTITIIMAAAVAYRKRKLGKNYSNLAEGDKEYFNTHLKPILELIVFVILYFPNSDPSDEIISLWRLRMQNKNAMITVKNSTTSFIDKEIQLDSARRIVVQKVKELEGAINSFVERLVRGTMELSG
jgi:hypothetical protein